MRLALPTWRQLARLAEHDSVSGVIKAAANADLRPVIGDPVDDPHYSDYFETNPVDRI